MSLAKIKYSILVNRYSHKIFGYAKYMLKNQMDAEDITQDVLLRIWENLNKFKVRKASSYIMRITHNICIDYLRKRKSVLVNTLDIEEFQETIPSFDNLSPESETHSKMILEKILITIQRLPENLRSPFLLYEIQGMKYKEIENILDLPLNTVKVNILRARKKLQEEMNKYEKQETV